MATNTQYIEAGYDITDNYDNIENIMFLIIFIKSYIKSLCPCLFLITLVFDPLINNSIGLGLKL